MNIKERLIDGIFWAAWNLLWLFPEWLTRSFFNLVAEILWRFDTRSVLQLRANLARLLEIDATSSEIKELSREAIKAGMRYYAETFVLARLSHDQIRNRIKVENETEVFEAVRRGGVVLTLPHSGNWDLAGAWAALEFGSMCTVAERLRPEGVYRKFLAMRQKVGMDLMPIRSESGVYEFLRNHLRNGKVIALMGDRDVAKSGMSNLFCGHRGSFPIGAALLAIDTGAPLFACTTYFQGKQLVIRFAEQIPVENIGVAGRDRLREAQKVTAVVLSRFENLLREHPESWHQLQPIWPDLNVRYPSVS